MKYKLIFLITDKKKNNSLLCFFERTIKEKKIKEKKYYLYVILFNFTFNNNIGQ